VTRRPSVFVLGLTVGDFLLWNWSLGANHDVIALVSGLSLPPLAIASLWVLALATGRLLALTARRPRARRAAAPGAVTRARAQTATGRVTAQESGPAGPPSSTSSGKLAA
jgi:hypothetical protein